jgi:hypothetical protein
MDTSNLSADQWNYFPSSLVTSNGYNTLANCMFTFSYSDSDCSKLYPSMDNTYLNL